jgi:DnaK suppressor protein
MERLVDSQAHPEAELTQAQVRELTDKLRSKRSELSAALAVLNQQIAAKDDCSVADAAEAASLQEGRIRAGGIADQSRQTIADIDAALSRLKNGQYGVSTISGEPIACERLMLVPWARTGANE